MVIGGDWNARIRRESGLSMWGWRGERNSMDNVKNGEGKDLLVFAEARGWKILNGNTEEDEEGRYTYERRNSRSVLDYAMVNAVTWEEVKRFVVGYRIDSDDQPVVVEVKGTCKIKKERKNGGGGSR